MIEMPKKCAFSALFILNHKSILSSKIDLSDYLITMKTSLAIMSILLCVSSAAPASQRSKSLGELSRSSINVWLRCQDEADTSSMARAMCSAEELGRQSELLERALAAARARLSKEPRARLASSQRRWEKFIDKECHVAELALQPGRGMDNIDQYKSCLAFAMGERVLWLERRYRRR